MWIGKQLSQTYWIWINRKVTIDDIYLGIVYISKMFFLDESHQCLILTAAKLFQFLLNSKQPEHGAKLWRMGHLDFLVNKMSWVPKTHTHFRSGKCNVCFNDKMKLFPLIYQLITNFDYIAMVVFLQRFQDYVFIDFRGNV